MYDNITNCTLLQLNLNVSSHWQASKHNISSSMSERIISLYLFVKVRINRNLEAPKLETPKLEIQKKNLSMVENSNLKIQKENIRMVNKLQENVPVPKKKFSWSNWIMSYAGYSPSNKKNRDQFYQYYYYDVWRYLGNFIINTLKNTLTNMLKKELKNRKFIS
jgi:hypothetical protein